MVTWCINNEQKVTYSNWSSPLNLSALEIFNDVCTMFQDITHEWCVDWIHIKHGSVCNLALNYYPSCIHSQTFKKYRSKKDIAYLLGMSLAALKCAVKTEMLLNRITSDILRSVTVPDNVGVCKEWWMRISKHHKRQVRVTHNKGE